MEGTVEWVRGRVAEIQHDSVCGGINGVIKDGADDLTVIGVAVL
ncbi:MAG TPA: hypothetical protein VFX60_11920 [Micromonospora sp.]|nr:hypothetical protein [Micromonospora sp.]